jgi:ribosomal protein L12E/L44/L45/RPP1/RPP2
MALEKQTSFDYEIRSEFKHIQERTKTSVMEDGKELSYSYSRRVLSPDADVSAESDEVKALAAALWTDEVKSAWAEKQAAEAAVAAAAPAAEAAPAE